MEPRDLVKVWDAPDNSKLTPKQWSIRLPIHVAAKINALCDMYPRKTKTEIIGDLLATALIQFEEALPWKEDRATGFFDDDGNEIFDMSGPRDQFQKLYGKYIIEIEEGLETERR